MFDVVGSRNSSLVEFVEHPVNGGGRNAHICPLRVPKVGADGGEHVEFTLEICRGSLAHPALLPRHLDHHGSSISQATPDFGWSAQLGADVDSGAEPSSEVVVGAQIRVCA